MYGAVDVVRFPVSGRGHFCQRGLTLLVLFSKITKKNRKTYYDWLNYHFVTTLQVGGKRRHCAIRRGLWVPILAYYYIPIETFKNGCKAVRAH